MPARHVLTAILLVGAGFPGAAPAAESFATSPSSLILLTDDRVGQTVSVTSTDTNFSGQVVITVRGTDCAEVFQFNAPSTNTPPVLTPVWGQRTTIRAAQGALTFKVRCKGTSDCETTVKIEATDHTTHSVVAKCRKRFALLYRTALWVAILALFAFGGYFIRKTRRPPEQPGTDADPPAEEPASGES